MPNPHPPHPTPTQPRSLLGSESNVVHSYAAIAIDRLLAMREPGGGGPRFLPADLAPLLQALLEKLFAAFKLPESGENEYLMRAVMRVIAFVGGWPRCCGVAAADGVVAPSCLGLGMLPGCVLGWREAG